MTKGLLYMPIPALATRRFSLSIAIALATLPLPTTANTAAGADCPTGNVQVVTTALIQAEDANAANQASIIGLPYQAPHRSRDFRGEAAEPATGSVYGLAIMPAAIPCYPGRF